MIWTLHHTFQDVYDTKDGMRDMITTMNSPVNFYVPWWTMAENGQAEWTL